MRIIDFHTHAFPDFLAEKAIAALEAESAMQAETDGAVAGLLALMDRHGVERSVVASIATKPGQSRSILEWSTSIASDRLVPFPSVHPCSENCIEEVERIAAAGLRGLKLHPLYQNFAADDPRVFPLYDAISEAGLILLMHAGYDIAFRDEDLALPERFLTVLGNFPRLKIVMAHLGGWRSLDGFAERLLGRDVYIETSFTRGFASEEQIHAILNGHDPERILFGSDSPWGRMADQIAFVEELAVSDGVKEKIFHGNAEALLA
ncbi:MAG TPA: amidohydrolase family protein [Sumerlaeia bacterium]|nr:amidohydrolase family protein [Sumerlaeia bacterium]